METDSKKSVNIPIEDPDKMILTKNKAQLILSQNSYAQSLQYCDISIAMAGTATEQFVGLGKPAIAFAGTVRSITQNLRRIKVAY